jgi:PAS domain S-box-containing protein
MSDDHQVTILLVDDQPAKLMAYEVILKDLNENLVTVGSGSEALEYLLKNDVAVLLVDVCMPELDGFELAAMIRSHPRFQKVAIIFISAIQVSDLDHLRGYEMGAVDYVPVPVVPEVLRAKVKVFAELYRKTRQIESMNIELEARVRARTAELERSHAKLLESEARRTLAIAAGKMGSWDWDCTSGDLLWDDGQYRIYGVDPKHFELTFENSMKYIHPDDFGRISQIFAFAEQTRSFETEFRLIRPDGSIRWCISTAAATFGKNGRPTRVSGVTIDLTERKLAEQRQDLLAREVDHRAKNALTIVQSLIRLTQAQEIESYVAALEGRIAALARAHTILSLSSWEGAEFRKLVSEELQPYLLNERIVLDGPELELPPTIAQTLALVIHELATNAAKYGCLSVPNGRLSIFWATKDNTVEIIWREDRGPVVTEPAARGFGTRSVIVSVESQLGGSAAFDWRPDGLVCALIVPMKRFPVSDTEVPTGREALTSKRIAV